MRIQRTNGEEWTVAQAKESSLTSGDVIKFTPDRFHFKIEFGSIAPSTSSDGSQGKTVDQPETGSAKKERKLPAWLAGEGSAEDEVGTADTGATPKHDNSQRGSSSEVRK